jgi:uroporphyrinogen decarboxylase
VDNLIPDFIDMGVDVLNPIDPSGSVQDIYEIKSKYGDRITLSGNINIDTILKDGSPEEVSEDVIEHMERLGKGGGYIVSSSHNLHELIPVENFYAMRDAVMEFGK